MIFIFIHHITGRKIEKKEEKQQNNDNGTCRPICMLFELSKLSVNRDYRQVHICSSSNIYLSYEITIPPWSYSPLQIIS